MSQFEKHIQHHSERGETSNVSIGYKIEILRLKPQIDIMTSLIVWLMPIN